MADERALLVAWEDWLRAHSGYLVGVPVPMRINAFLAARPPQTTPPAPRINEPSMGALISYTVCSICGHDSRQDDLCPHVPPSEKRVSVLQDVTATLTPGAAPTRFFTGIHPSEISPPVKTPADHVATFDLREALADIVEDACVGYVKDQYAGTGLFGEQAADRIRELLLTRGVVLTPWIKEE